MANPFAQTALTKPESPRIPPVKIASYQGIVDKSANWRELGAAPEELAESDRATG